MDWDVILALLIFVALAAAGAVGGVLFARHRLRSSGDNPDELKIGAWRINTLAGSSAANALTRARIAIQALLAMHRQETIYFFASQDDRGQPLDPAQDWEISGKGFDCRWWSFTLYDQDFRLIASPSQRYSVHSDNVVPEPDGSYRIVLSRREVGANWLTCGEAKKLIVTLRLYNPSQAVLDDVASVKLPSIRRIEAGRAAA